LRTETTINNTYDFGIGRKPRNLLKLLEAENIASSLAFEPGLGSVTTSLTSNCRALARIAATF
jgi:hypothetical protein